MLKDEILEYPYTCSIYRVVQGKGDEDDKEELIYQGVCDEHMTTVEEGHVLQTSSYIISIPLVQTTPEVEGDEPQWIVPRKGDKIELERYGEEIILQVDNSEPSQLGGVSISATRKSW